jgi:hypothetical protein
MERLAAEVLEAHPSYQHATARANTSRREAEETTSAELDNMLAAQNAHDLELIAE